METEKTTVEIKDLREYREMMRGKFEKVHARLRELGDLEKQIAAEKQQLNVELFRLQGEDRALDAFIPRPDETK